jgi:hypothetical protein
VQESIEKAEPARQAQPVVSAVWSSRSAAMV